jgi:effector-binding domain-containing protein
MIKKILLGLLIIVVLFVIVGFFLPGKVEMSRSVSVNAPPEYAFEEVNSLEKWNEWSYWNSIDTAVKINYGDKREGAGAFYTWDGKVLGQGKLTTTESVPNSSIKQDLEFTDNGVANAWYDFKPSGDSTKVTLGFSTDFGMNPIARWMWPLMMKSEMNKAFEHNLLKIKERAESKPKFSIAITEENTTPVSYIGLNHTMSPKDTKAVAAQMGKMYSELFSVLKKSNVQPTGPAFCLFPKYSEESMDFVCAIPVDGAAKLPAKYSIMQTAGGRAVKTVYTGSYDNMQPAHDELNKYIAYKKLEYNGPAWEVYVTDPMVEKDPSKYVTEIYYAVK